MKFLAINILLIVLSNNFLPYSINFPLGISLSMIDGDFILIGGGGGGGLEDGVASLLVDAFNNIFNYIVYVKPIIQFNC